MTDIDPHRAKETFYSRDYSWLWDFLMEHEDCQVPGFIDYLFDKNDPDRGGCRDVVAVRIDRPGKRLDIGTRGMGYSTWEDGKEAFIAFAKKLNLEFIKVPFNRLIKK